MNGCSWGPFTPSVSVNAAVTLAILFSLKTIESLENGLQTHSGVTSIVFNENRIASVTAAFMLTLGIKWPCYKGRYKSSLLCDKCV